MIKAFRMLVTIISLGFITALPSTASAVLIKTDTVSNLVWSDGTVMSGYISVVSGATGNAAVQAFNYVFSGGTNNVSFSLDSASVPVYSYSTSGFGIYEAEIYSHDWVNYLNFRVHVASGEPQNGSLMSYDNGNTLQTLTSGGVYNSYIGAYDVATMSPFGSGGGGTSAVPEPGSVMLMGSGLLGMLGFRRRELLAYFKK